VLDARPALSHPAGHTSLGTRSSLLRRLLIMTSALQDTFAAGAHHNPNATYSQDSKHFQDPEPAAHDGSLDARGHDISALRHKVDRRIVPILFLCYLMNFIDKVALNVRTVVVECQNFTILIRRPVCGSYGSQQGPRTPSERVLKRSNRILRRISVGRDTHR
jgi:hypothetical protein